MTAPTISPIRLRPTQTDPFGAARSASRERTSHAERASERLIEGRFQQLESLILSLTQENAALKTRIDTLESTQRSELNAQSERSQVNDRRVDRLSDQLGTMTLKLKDLTALMKEHTHPCRYMTTEGGMAYECTSPLQEWAKYPRLI